MLFQTQQTWTGCVLFFTRITQPWITLLLFSRLKRYGQSCRFHFTVDITAQYYPILTFVENLPHDSMYLLPCPTSLGGVVVITSNAIVYVDQPSRQIVLPVNGWTSRISDIPTLSVDAAQKVVFEGSRALFVDEKLFSLSYKMAQFTPWIFWWTERLSKLTTSPPLAQTSIPSVVRNIGADHIFIGSTAGPSVLLKAATDHGNENEEVPTAVVQEDDAMEYGDEDEGLQLIHDCLFPLIL